MTPKRTITLTLANARISYSEHIAVNIPSLTICGSVISLLGHNGAGKSTLIKSILGLLDLERGSLSISDYIGNSLIPERDMAFCPENGAVFADVTVQKYLELWCRIKHNSSTYYRRDGAHYIEVLDLPPLLKKKGRELSKGQRRRVQTALGFMSDPKLFLFDEPFDSLDVQRTAELMELVKEESNNRAFIISSHRLDVMERVSDAVMVLKHGELAAAGPLAEVQNVLYGATKPTGVVGNLTDAMANHLQVIAEEAKGRAGNLVAATR
jgi:ABC-2 type transport system ATP-binding protein